MDYAVGMDDERLDVLIVGAGMSGLGAAVHLKRRCPERSFALVEARSDLGGTWDVFRYPGVRSDTTMYAYAFPFRPWMKRQAFGTGEAIQGYLRDTAREAGIDRAIRFRHRVRRARWSSEEASWRVEVERPDGKVAHIRCSFLVMGCGYYDPDQGHDPAFPDEDRFQGTIVHAQHWPADLKCAGQRVVVIGSGATAVTLVPALAKEAAHVTMLQRSPSYVVSVDAERKAPAWLHNHVSPTIAKAYTMLDHLFWNQGFYAFCRRFPERARRFLRTRMRAVLGEGYDIDTHFSPDYAPWDQRMCIVPDNDLFLAIRSGNASVVTDRIASFTESGIRLESGQALPADVIVKATGLTLRFLGGIELEVDGRRIDPKEALLYRGVMLTDVPNMVMIVGYLHLSWTLRVELVATYLCRLLRTMDRRGYDICTPQAPRETETQSALFLTSGYIERGRHLFPGQGRRPPFRTFRNYLRDAISLRFEPIRDGVLAFSTRRPAARAPSNLPDHALRSAG